MQNPSGSDLHLGLAAAAVARSEIDRARGNEVCFLASVAEDGELEGLRVISRGHSSAVLAVLRDPTPGGVVLHNHPSGSLDPSDADLEVAKRLWESGLGFAITDNTASELYVVLEPPALRRYDPVDLDAIEADLAPGGAVAHGHPAYEDRPQQRAFSRMIAGLYNDGGAGMAEAGTGTGKSVAYLLPAIRWAQANRERTVVSTATINLQEQLVGKDLPFLRRSLGVPFSFTLVKGRGNYVSIRRARLAAESAPDLLESGREAELRSIVEWIDATSDGSLSDLPFRPSPEVWDEVASESDVCLRAKCPHFQDCFYQRSRRAAASSDVLVVNHHLLFSDVAVRHSQGNYDAPAVLPPYRRLILDEAHNLEEIATRHLGSTVSRRSLFRILRRFENRGKGLLPALTREMAKRPDDLLTRAALDQIADVLIPTVRDARARAEHVFALLEILLEGRSDGMLRIDSSFAKNAVWKNGLDEELPALLAKLDDLLRGAEALRERIALDESARDALEPRLMELRGGINRLDAAAFALRAALQPGDDALSMVRWMEGRRDPRGGQNGAPAPMNVVLAAAPLDLAETFRESILDRVPTVVFTSATLATRSDFNFFRSRLGLAEEDGVVEAIYPSPFEFPTQTLVAIPVDLPAPTLAGHDEATARAIIEHARISDGGLFVLFTSHRALRDVAGKLAGRREAGAWPLFVQGDAPRARLIERFIESGSGILLGTTSFWEGVDVPGRPLRGLIIPRIPFKVPSEPITAARVEAIEARGANAFTSYMLPHAAIRLKQGFGRLIRSRTDRGAVLILDPRIATKSYGRYLLESLPPAPVVTGSWSEVHDALRRFYGSEAVSPLGPNPAIDVSTSTTDR